MSTSFSHCSKFYKIKRCVQIGFYQFRRSTTYAWLMCHQKPRCATVFCMCKRSWKRQRKCVINRESFEKITWMLCTSQPQQKELEQKKFSLRSRSFSPFIRLREWKTNYNNSWRSNFSFYGETDARRRNPLFCQMILSFIDDAKSRRKSWILKQLCVFIFTSQRRAEHTHTHTARSIMCPAYTAAQPFSRPPRHGRDKMRDARERVCIYMAKETRKQDMA
jgi:hypothetical protein